MEPQPLPRPTDREPAWGEALPPEERARLEAGGSRFARLAVETPMPLDSGAALQPVDIAYCTFGTLNAERSNAILLCHPLTGDQFAIGRHPVTGREGWAETLVGPGKPIDTDRYFVICSNVLGGCMGSSGPATLDPATGRLWATDFPVITIPDMVRAQALLLDSLGIERLFCVVGGSMGGMQALVWASAYPARVFACMPIATASRHSAQNIAFNEVGRQAIMADPDWQDGGYAGSGRSPRRGLAVARMAAHITYMSEPMLHRKFGRQLQDRQVPSFGFDADFQVESYLRHQGSSFVERFDANSYLYITRALDYFDLGASHGGGVLARAFQPAGAASTPVRFCVVSFSSDWLYPTEDSRALVHALNSIAAAVSFVEIVTHNGHDAFLLDEPDFYGVVSGFLEGAERHRVLLAESA